MSAITFPHGYPAHSPSFVDEDGPGSSYDMLGSASGFQMNPLSAHPPRTPRTSLVASTSIPETRSTRTSLYMEESVPQESAVIEESEGEEVEVEVASESARTKAARARVRREDVWREIVKSSNGRDKALKLIQYTLRVYLLFHNALARRTTLGAPRAWQIELLSRLNSTTSGLSLTRKCLLLFNWLSPLTAILAENAASVDGPPTGASGTTIPRGPKPLLHTFLHAPPPVLLELLNAAADDVSTWARLGLLGGKTGERAARLANWCWFASTLVGLVENGVERSVIVGSRRAVEGRMWTDSMSGQTAKSQPKNTKIDESELQKLQTQDYWLQVHRAKLIMDLVFVSCDVFRVKRGKNSVQTFTGLASAVLSSAKLYDRSRGTLLKAVRY